MHVASRPGVEIIDAQNFVAAFLQPIAKVRSNKSGSAGDEDTTFRQHGRKPSHIGSKPRADLASCEPVRRSMSKPFGIRRRNLFRICSGSLAGSKPVGVILSELSCG